MKKIYLFQHIHSLTIYQFDLLHYDARQDYRDVCNFLFAIKGSLEFSNQEYYFLLAYVLSSFSGFNKKHKEYQFVQSGIYTLFGKSFVQDIRKTFSDKFIYLGKTSIVYNF